MVLSTSSNLFSNHNELKVKDETGQVDLSN